MSLFQERLRHEPFWMLCACVLVNRTRWSQAESVLNEVRERWPTPHQLSWAGQEELEEVLRPLGFGRQRARRLQDLANEWQRWWVFLQKRPATASDVLTLPGCGKYASDSWAIFVEGRLDVCPTDRALKAFLTDKIND